MGNSAFGIRMEFSNNFIKFSYFFVSTRLCLIIVIIFVFLSTAWLAFSKTFLGK